MGRPHFWVLDTWTNLRRGGWYCLQRAWKKLYPIIHLAVKSQFLHVFWV